jgi:riboflavin kinase
MTMSSSESNVSNNLEGEFLQKQKALSNKISDKNSSPTTMDTSTHKITTTTTAKEHLEHQTKVFDEMATYFASGETTPPEVVPILKAMVDTMLSKAIDLRTRGRRHNRHQESSRPARATTSTKYDDDDDHDDVYRILDVGCGAGVLFDYFLEAAQDKGVTLCIHGLDVAPKMVDQARAHAEALLLGTCNKVIGNDNDNDNKKHTITVHLGDITHWKPQQSSSSSSSYDVVVANACFGNFWDPQQALQSMTNCLRLDGLLCITHPLGSDFVRQLQEEDPITVPHLLPTTNDDFQQLARTLPLRVLDIVDKIEKEGGGDNNKYYMASAVKVVYHTLPQIMRLRGQVDSGYGRGGKKLGFPTANLPSRLFRGALQDVPCGVYFGWVVLEQQDDAALLDEENNYKKKKGRNMPHKAVVNVGYSPTFEGQENPEKIVEAHFILPQGDAAPITIMDPPDFYGEVMRLQLIGFLRPEMKFPSFPDLIAQISTDVADAKDALDLEFYRRFQKDDFVKNCDEVWVGSGGGNETASWDIEEVEAANEELSS